MGQKKRGEAHCHLDLYIPVTLQRGLKAQLGDHLVSITSFLLVTHKQRQAVRQDGSPLLLRILSPPGGARHLPSLCGSALSAGEAFPVIASRGVWRRVFMWLFMPLRVRRSGLVTYVYIRWSWVDVDVHYQKWRPFRVLMLSTAVFCPREASILPMGFLWPPPEY